jgi:hypothetical protein
MMDILRVIKIHSTTLFGREVKPLVPCHKIYGKLKNPMRVKEILHKQNLAAISHQVSPASLLVVSARICLRAVVDESGMIRTQMGMHSRSGNGHSTWDCLYDTAP